MQVAISAWRSFSSRAFLSYSSCVIRQEIRDAIDKLLGASADSRRR
jgi:hypothetical protein